MKYCSTRGGVSELNFNDAVMMGLAEDGGLLIPQELPRIREKLKGWRSLTYQDLCLEVLYLFVGESVDRSELKAMIQRSYASFRTSTITPIMKFLPIPNKFANNPIKTMKSTPNLFLAAFGIYSLSLFCFMSKQS